MPKDNSSGETPVAPTLVKPVVNAVALLRYLGETGASATVTQLSRHLSINTSTCFNILRTLVAEGLLVFDEEAKTYTIGIGAVQIAQHGLSASGKLEVISPLLDGLAEKYGVTVTFWRCTDDQRHLVLGSSSPDSVFRIQLQIGYASPLYAGAFGRALAAHQGLDEAGIAEVYNSLHWANPPGLTQYMEDVEAARSRIWAIDDGAFAAGVTNLSIVIPSTGQGPMFGLVTSMFQGQLSPSELDGLGADLRALSQQISGLH